MSIRFRILIPMVIISILASSTILFFNIIQFTSFVDGHFEDELERAVLKVNDEIEVLKSKAYASVLYYSNDPALIKALELGDRDAVMKRTSELYSETSVESISVVDTSAIVLARGHNPDFFGDDTSDIDVVLATLEGNKSVVVVRGISTSISVRATSPIYNSEGRMLGAIFSGDRLDSDTFVDKLKAFTGCEIAVFVDDMLVATTLYNDDGTRAIGSPIPGYIDNALLSGDEATRLVSFQGSELMIRHTPVYNDGELIGLVSVGKHLTDNHNMVISFITIGFLVSVVFISFSILIIFYVSRKIAAPITRSIGLANYDRLTGIFNRRYFDERFNILLKTLSRSNGIVSLLMIDIDFFKNYNDTYGHVKGDDCLKTVAGMLAKTITRGDDFVARYGGEEFVIVLPNTNETGAHHIARKLLEAMRNCKIPHERSDVADHVTISIGGTTCSVNQSLNCTDLINRADAGLYESKRNGRNRYTFTAME